MLPVSESIANADFADWVTVFGYGAAAVLCWRAARRGALPREIRFWKLLAIAMAALALNELLDLQTAVTAIGRDMARADGWYADRRRVQLLFLGVLVAAAALGGILLLGLIRRMPATIRAASAGLAFIAAFVLLRAASFHHFDALLEAGPAVFRWGSVQEVLGIAIVAAAAARYRRTGGAGRK